MMGGLIVTPHDRSRRLGTPTNVGHLRLHAPEQPLVEWLRAAPRALDGIDIFESWPVVVQGTEVAEARQVADRQASGLLHRVAALLSLTWNEPWQERSAPRDRSSFKPAIPDSWPAPLGDRLHAPTPRADTDLPPWLGTAWVELDKDPRLARATSFWHQGILAAPSLDKKLTKSPETLFCTESPTCFSD